MRGLPRVLFAACLWAAAAPVSAADAGCIACHASLLQARVVHAPVQGSCDACHVAVDARVTPHVSSTPVAKGVKANAVAACTTCHEASLFEGPVVHGALLAGGCEVCHDPHASRWQGLLKKEPAQLCLECHPEVAKRPHVVAGMRRGSHPIGIEAKVVKDPLRPGKDFYCAACHEPHRAATARLTRFGRDMEACRKCHKV